MPTHNHNNSPFQLLVRITEVMNQIRLRSPTDRDISVYYTTSNRIWDDRFMVKAKDFSYLMATWSMNLPASRALIHVTAASLKFVPRFSVNVTAYTPPEDPVSGRL